MSTRLISRIPFLLSLVSLPVVVLACGGGEPTTAPPAAPAATATATRVAAATATAGPAPTKAAAQPTGEARLAMGQVRELFGDPPISPYASTPDPEQLGITESLFVYSNLNPMAPNVADSWQVSADGLTLTLKLKKGVKFNTPPALAGKDFGELTAADVAWNMNRQNAGVNLQIRSGLGAQFGATFKEAKAVDATTVEAPLVTQIVWGFPLSEFVIQDADLAIMSKAAYEQLGAEAVKFVPIGTGSFVIGQWVPNERGTVEAVPNHWSKTAAVAKFTVLQVPEITSRIAMLETGQVQFAEMDFAKLKELRGKGLDFLATQSDLDTENASVVWPGNLWEVTHPRTGAALEPWKSVVYEQDYPWIGNPWGDKTPYTDTDNPQGMSDMEQARLVRWALSYAIDRDGIVEKLQSGLGSPIYIEYMGPLYPGWDANRTVTQAAVDAILEKHGGTAFPEYKVTSPLPTEKWPWKIAFDQKKAEAMLDQAGYPRKAGGVRFTIKLNKYRCETGDVCLEQADAVATSWEAIGVKTDLLTEEYGAVVVPRMANRTQFWPVVKNCSVESANEPLDWPLPPADNSISRPSWGCAFETQFNALMYKKINGEKDKATREQWHLDAVDYMYYWQLYSGVAQQPRGVAYDPKKVASWKARSTQGWSWLRPEFIVMK